MKIYIASPFFNEEQKTLVKKLEVFLEKNNHKVYSPSRDGGILNKESTEMDKIRTLAENIGAIRWCDFVVAVIDGRDSGTIWEQGYAYGIEKPVIAFTNNDFGLNVMIARTVYSYAKTFDELEDALNNITIEYRGDIQ